MSKKMNQKHFITVENTKTGNQWEEELNSMYVTKESPHERTHEIGMHTLEIDLTKDQLNHYGENIVSYFNKTLRPHEAPRKFISCRIENMQ